MNRFSDLLKYLAAFFFEGEGFVVAQSANRPGTPPQLRNPRASASEERSSDALIGSKENDEVDPPAKRSRVADEEEGAEVCRSVFSVFFVC